MEEYIRIDYFHPPGLEWTGDLYEVLTTGYWGIPGGVWLRFQWISECWAVWTAPAAIFINFTIPAAFSIIAGLPGRCSLRTLCSAVLSFSAKTIANLSSASCSAGESRKPGLPFAIALSSADSGWTRNLKARAQCCYGRSPKNWRRSLSTGNQPRNPHWLSVSYRSPTPPIFVCSTEIWSPQCSLKFIWVRFIWVSR